MFTRVVHSIHFKKFDGGHLVFKDGQNQSVSFQDNMKNKVQVWNWLGKLICIYRVHKLIFPLTVHIFHKFYGGHLDLIRWPKINSTLPSLIWHYKSNLKSIDETILKISRSQGMSIAYILKSLMAAILVSEMGPKWLGSVRKIIWKQISSLKLIGERVLKI